MYHYIVHNQDNIVLNSARRENFNGYSSSIIALQIAETELLENRLNIDEHAIVIFTNQENTGLEDRQVNKQHFRIVNKISGNIVADSASQTGFIGYSTNIRALISAEREMRTGNWTTKDYSIIIYSK